MHEQSLVRSLLTQVEQIRLEQGAVLVTRIEVEIGPLSGVEPLLVREAFDRLIGPEAHSEMKLCIHEVPLQCRCRDCDAEWSAGSFRFVCPECGATSVRILSGDEFRLRNITVQLPERAEVTA